MFFSSLDLAVWIRAGRAYRWKKLFPVENTKSEPVSHREDLVRILLVWCGAGNLNQRFHQIGLAVAVGIVVGLDIHAEAEDVAALVGVVRVSEIGVLQNRLGRAVLEHRAFPAFRERRSAQGQDHRQREQDAKQFFHVIGSFLSRREHVFEFAVVCFKPLFRFIPARRHPHKSTKPPDKASACPEIPHSVHYVVYRMRRSCPSCRLSSLPLCMV